MKTEHTPGPWKTNALYSQVHSENGLQICEVSVNENSDKFKYEQWKANGLLIAAAPELLDALQLARNILHQKYNYTALEYFDNIIEKAKGKSQ